MNAYQAGYRRMLVDMHIPDWDPGFMTQYDPVRMAELYERANLSSVMLYCKSHTGLCNWPTKVGKMHHGLGGRDVVGELVAELNERGIATCAYTSVVFENWAVETHPDWRQRTGTGFDAQDYTRYGFACMNNPEYRQYERDLITELLSAYRFDALFVDMPFWPMQCECEHCIAKLRAETHLTAAPAVVDWTTPEWPTWQAAREQWSDEFIDELATLARGITPGIAFTHNLAPSLNDYAIAQPVRASRHDDFVAGDLYGDRYEQLFVTKLSSHLTEIRPAEFMTSRCVNLGDHVRIKREDEMLVAALAATAMSSAFLFIDAIDPAGTANDAVFDRVGRIFDQTEPYEQFLGGTPIEDVAVYYSADSQMDFADNGLAISAVRTMNSQTPHGDAVKGACRVLQRAHIPFGVITRKQIGVLDQWKVLVLPNVLRMDDEELSAIRAFVARGGRLYASRWTSVVDTAGAHRGEFGLADLFGVSLAGEEEGRVVYYKPATKELADALWPQDYLSVSLKTKPLCRIPRLAPGGATTLATRTMPYAHPAPGNVKDHQWASIHSSPPWSDGDEPMLVANAFGDGRVIYSAADVELLDAEANDAVFLHAINELLAVAPSFNVDTHPAVVVNAFDQPDRGRVVITFLHHAAEVPALPTRARLRIQAPAGSAITAMSLAPDGASIPFEFDGTYAVAEVDPIDVLSVVVASYA